jgi:hypothetical protein
MPGGLFGLQRKRTPVLGVFQLRHRQQLESGMTSVGQMPPHLGVVATATVIFLLYFAISIASRRQATPAVRWWLRFRVVSGEWRRRLIRSCAPPHRVAVAAVRAQSHGWFIIWWSSWWSLRCLDLTEETMASSSSRFGDGDVRYRCKRRPLANRS